MDMNEYDYQGYTIAVFNDGAYSYGSADNRRTYDRQYFGRGAQEHPTSKHRVTASKDDGETSSCMLTGSGGATGINSYSTLLDRDRLLVCCCNTLFCLSLPSLDLIWQAEADWATVFGVYKLDEDYLTHGEVSISRIGHAGKIKWQFDDADIFISLDGSETFRLENDHIFLSDFNGATYRINFDGILL